MKKGICQVGHLGIRKRAHCRVRASQESSPACNELTFWGVVKWLRHGFLVPSSDDLDSSHRQVNVVMDHQNILRVETKEIDAGPNRVTTPIHKGRRPKKDHIHILILCPGKSPLKTLAVQTDPQRFCPQIYDLKPYVVACISILQSWVSKTSYQIHRLGPAFTEVFSLHWQLLCCRSFLQPQPLDLQALLLHPLRLRPLPPGPLPPQPSVPQPGPPSDRLPRG